MKENFAPLLTGIAFLFIGIVCLLGPGKIQQRTLDFYARHDWAAKLNPFLDWMKTSRYIWYLRIIGIVAIGIFILSLYVIFFTSDK